MPSMEMVANAYGGYSTRRAKVTRIYNHPAIGRPLHVKIDCIVAFRDILCQCRLANLPRPKQDNPGLVLVYEALG